MTFLQEFLAEILSDEKCYFFLLSAESKKISFGLFTSLPLLKGDKSVMIAFDLTRNGIRKSRAGLRFTKAISAVSGAQ